MKFSQTEIDKKFLRLALSERHHSQDPRAERDIRSAVGAVIVKNSHLISASANILPPDLELSYRNSGRGVSEKNRYFVIEHAERAAIYKALCQNSELKGTTMYCTRAPCSDCARAIVWVGLKRLVLSNGLDKKPLWLESQRVAFQILRESGVKVRVLTKVD